MLNTDNFANAMIAEAERLTVGCQELKTATTPEERTMWKKTIVERVAAIEWVLREHGETYAMLQAKA